MAQKEFALTWNGISTAMMSFNRVSSKNPSQLLAGQCLSHRIAALARTLGSSKKYSILHGHVVVAQVVSLRLEGFVLAMD